MLGKPGEFIIDLFFKTVFEAYDPDVSLIRLFGVFTICNRDDVELCLYFFLNGVFGAPLHTDAALLFTGGNVRLYGCDAAVL